MKKYKLWLEPSKSQEAPMAPAIIKLMLQVTLECAIIADVVELRCSEVDRDPYIKNTSMRFRTTIVEVLKKERIFVTEAELDRICHGVASETFIIRRLYEAVLNREMSLDDVKQVPFYETYRGYFERSEEVESKTAAIVLMVAEMSQS